MWNYFSNLIFKNKLILIALLIIVTLFMLNSARDVKLSYTIAKLLPSDHKVSLDFDYFTQKYGENNIIVIGVDDPNFNNIEHVKDWNNISESIEYKIEDALDALPKAKKSDDDFMIGYIEKAIRNHLFGLWGKKPFIKVCLTFV